MKKKEYVAPRLWILNVKTESLLAAYSQDEENNADAKENIHTPQNNTNGSEGAFGGSSPWSKWDD